MENDGENAAIDVPANAPVNAPVNTSAYASSSYTDHIADSGSVNEPVNVPVNVPVDVPINKTACTLLALIAENPTATYITLTESMKLDRKTIQRNMQILKNAGLLKRI